MKRNNLIIIGVIVIVAMIVISLTLYNFESENITKTWCAIPLDEECFLLTNELGTKLLIDAENCGACTAISRSTSLDQIVSKEEKWRIDEGLVGIDYSLCKETTNEKMP